MAKQTEDTKTLALPGMPEPKKRGRKPLGARAMTPAEKQAAYRKRLKQSDQSNKQTYTYAELVSHINRLLEQLAGLSKERDWLKKDHELMEAERNAAMAEYRKMKDKLEQHGIS